MNRMEQVIEINITTFWFEVNPPTQMSQMSFTTLKLSDIPTSAEIFVPQQDTKTRYIKHAKLIVSCIYDLFYVVKVL